MCKKMFYVLSAVVVMAVAMVMFFPMTGTAGSLEPSAAPAPTMKTLDQIPPSWSFKLPASERFVVLAEFNNAAVLDKETGLVWEKEPSISARGWESSTLYCVEKYLGGRGGWRLPTIEQLWSLVDRSAAGTIKLPDGHPFINVQEIYWTATTSVTDPNNAWILYFSFGGVFDPVSKPALYNVWCVRGGQSYDAY